MHAGIIRLGTPSHACLPIKHYSCICIVNLLHINSQIAVLHGVLFVGLYVVAFIINAHAGAGYKLSVLHGGLFFWQGDRFWLPKLVQETSSSTKIGPPDRFWGGDRFWHDSTNRFYGSILKENVFVRLFSTHIY